MLPFVDPEIFRNFWPKSLKNGKYGKIVFDSRLVLHLTTNNNKFIIDDQQMATLYFYIFSNNKKSF